MMVRDNIMYQSTESQAPPDTSCIEVYEKICSNMLTALMFHEQATDLFDFLSLHGFKRMHEYQYMAESVERRRLKRYVLNHHNILVKDAHSEKLQIIPKEWYNYTRKDVTPQVRTQYIEKIFSDYCDWEKSSKQLYETCAKGLYDLGLLADFQRVMELVEDVDCELKILERLYLEIKSVDYNEVTLLLCNQNFMRSIARKQGNLILKSRIQAEKPVFLWVNCKN